MDYGIGIYFGKIDNRGDSLSLFFKIDNEIYNVFLLNELQAIANSEKYYTDSFLSRKSSC